MNYFLIRSRHSCFGIVTAVEMDTLDKTHASMIAQRVMPEMGAKNLVIRATTAEEAMDLGTDVRLLTIRDTLPDGTEFLRTPGATYPIMLIRTDNPDATIITVPSFLAKRKNREDAVRSLFRQIAANASSAGMFSVDKMPPTIDDVLDLPPGFLLLYGVEIIPNETALTMGYDGRNTL